MIPLNLHFKDQEKETQRSSYGPTFTELSGARTGIQVCLSVCLTPQPMFPNTVLSYSFVNIPWSLLGAVFSLCPKLPEGMCISVLRRNRTSSVHICVIHMRTYTYIHMHLYRYK